MLRMTQCLVHSALTLSLMAGGGALAVAAAQSAAPRPIVNVRPRINVSVPDTMQVSVREPVAVRARLDDAVTVKLAEPRPWLGPEVLAALVGVLLGFLVAEVGRSFQGRRRRRDLKAALRDECRSLLSQVPLLIDVCRQLIKSLQGHRLLRGPAVRAMRTVYDATIVELTPHLTREQRNVLHVVHERLRVGDELIATHGRGLLEDLREQLVNDPWGAWIAHLEDQIESYGVVQRLLTSFLAGTPEDVFPARDRGPNGDAEAGAGRQPAPVVPPTFGVARNFLRIVGSAGQALHGISAKINAGLAVFGARGLRPDLQRLQSAIKEFKASEGRLVELRQPTLEAKLAKAFQDIERQYARIDAIVAPYEPREVAPGSWSSNPAFRTLPVSVQSHVAVLDALTNDLEMLTK